MSNYSSFDYWNKRYEDEEGMQCEDALFEAALNFTDNGPKTSIDSPYDWLFAYTDVNDVMEFLIPDKQTDILMIGCGNAPFSPDM